MRIRPGKATALLLGALVLASAQAREVPYNITMCHSISFNQLAASRELNVFGYEGRGIAFSNTDDKTLDNATYHCIGVMRSAAGTLTQNGYCRFLSADGDSFVGEYTHSGPPGSEARWMAMHGTGKWAGIKGGGPYRQVTRGMPITPGSGQACNRATGTYTLPD